MEKKGFYGTSCNVSSMPYTSPAASGGYPAQNMQGVPFSGSFTGQVGFGGSNFPANVGPTNFGPTNFGPTQVAPAQVSPTNHTVNTNVMKHIVPHIHPSHTTCVNQHVFEHQHYFPHTTSVVNKCCSRHVFCGTPMGFGHHGAGHHGGSCC